MVSDEESIAIHKVKKQILSWLQSGRTHEEISDMILHLQTYSYNSGWHDGLYRGLNDKNNKRKWWSFNNKTKEKQNEKSITRYKDQDIK